MSANILDFLIVVAPLLLSIAYLTLLERKVLAIIQIRRGPNVVGIIGLLQPISDGIKLLFKEIIIPFNSNKIMFFMSPVFVFLISILNWMFIPTMTKSLYNFETNTFFLFAISSLSVYGIVIAGWASNSKYSLLGALRAISQMLSYELTLFFSIFPLVMQCESLNLQDIYNSQNYLWNLFVFPLSFICFLVSAFAETNRTPFDLPEAEGELVSGYNIEFSSMVFALFFLAEYCNILLMSMLITIFFFGKSLFFTILACKATLITILFIIIRAILPRYRYDQLILIGWLVLLPLTLAVFTYTLVSLKMMHWASVILEIT
jgi:NADH-quinone oxidoreductase subunit H